MKSITGWLLAALAMLSLQTQAADAPAQIRIGYQKGSVSMVLAKSHRLLEQRFPDTKIQWIEFPAGPQMLEALNRRCSPRRRAPICFTSARSRLSRRLR